MRFSVFLNARTMSADADKQLIIDLERHALLAGELGFDAIFSRMTVSAGPKSSSQMEVITPFSPKPRAEKVSTT